MDKYDFLKESVRNIRTIGTFTRSSKYLVKAMLKDIDFSKDMVIVEYGVGDGVITEMILERLSPNSQLIAFEVNEMFYQKVLQNIHDNRMILLNCSAETILEKLQEFQIEKADHIISAIPFTILPQELSEKIVENSHNSLKIGGFFVQYHYSFNIRKMYQKIFGNLRMSFVAQNFPPAFVMTCIKN
jgi:phospholipid N-methyltransferase